MKMLSRGETVKPSPLAIRLEILPAWIRGIVTNSQCRRGRVRVRWGRYKSPSYWDVVLVAKDQKAARI